MPFKTEQVPCSSLHDNRLGEFGSNPPPTCRVTVWVPSGYDAAADLRYPVLFLLPGYLEDDQTWEQRFSISTALEQADPLGPGGARSVDLIVVMPNCCNSLGGSFCTDSSTIGDWETFLVRDLVAYIDQHYRTRSELGGLARCIAGHSMGGTAALTLALKHPGVFGGVYAMSPSEMDWVNGSEFSLDLDSESWTSTLFYAARRNGLELVQSLVAWGKSSPPPQGPLPDGMMDLLFCVTHVALAVSWSPSGRKPLFADLPMRQRPDGSLQLVESVKQQWQDRMILPRLRAGSTSGAPRGLLEHAGELWALGFEVGDDDQFAHIPVTCSQLDTLLAGHSIPHQFTTYPGDHFNCIHFRLKDVVFPFLLQNLPEVAVVH